jgi:hypothetical protein
MVDIITKKVYLQTGDGFEAGNMRAGSNGAKPKNGSPGIRTRYRQMRATLTEGLRAALRADPEVLEKCKPKTGYGLLVRGLLVEAAKGKTISLKTVMSLIDGEPDAGEDVESRETLDETRRDWSLDGEWQTVPEAAAAHDEAGDDEDGPARKELLRRLEQLMLGDEADRKRAAAIVHAMHAGNFEHPNGPAIPP